MVNDNRGGYYVVDTGEVSNVPKIAIYGSLNNQAS